MLDPMDPLVFLPEDRSAWPYGVPGESGARP